MASQLSSPGANFFTTPYHADPIQHSCTQGSNTFILNPTESNSASFCRILVFIKQDVGRMIVLLIPVKPIR
jgi:hypothetical protein